MDRRSFAVAALSALVCRAAGAQTHQPYEGQPGQDCRWVPTPLGLKHGTRIVNNGYRIPGWQEDGTADVGGTCITWCTAYLYLVPARVAGAWRLANGVIGFAQEIGRLSGTLVSANGRRENVQGSVKGDQIRFSAGLDAYTGRVRGNVMSDEASGAIS